ncbi:MAG: 3-oxoacid CoA-transferase subunit B [Clostridia bacterium]|nr:3-oxoacid CoA-transferase subunit B [Clostridia bacterium]
MNAKETIVTRAARFFKDGDVVNLGIGMPTMIMEHIPEGIDVWFDSENGVIGLEQAPGPGEEVDNNIVDASGDAGTLRKGACCFSSFDSFGLIRGGHVAYTVLGAYEVDEKGNLANWMVPGKTCAGMGGAMDLVTGARNVLVTMTHTDKEGNAKIKKQCTLPLTGAGVVTNIITELCVIDVTPEGLVLRELAPGVTAEEVQAKTEATLIIPDEIGSMF